MLGHTGEVLEKKPVFTRWGVLATQGRVRIKCWHMFECRSNLVTDLKISAQARRRDSGSHACARGFAKFRGRGDPHASGDRRGGWAGITEAIPHRYSPAPFCASRVGVIVEAGRAAFSDPTLFLQTLGGFGIGCPPWYGCSAFSIHDLPLLFHVCGRYSGARRARIQCSCTQTPCGAVSAPMPSGKPARPPARSW